MRENLRSSSSHLPTLLAWTVHLYTSLGLLLGFLALRAATEGRARDVVVLMAFACLIDATDGQIARHFRVRDVTPQFDGQKLDDITDYLNYVVVPVFFAYRFRLISPAWTPVLLLVLLASAYGFCHKAAKIEDRFFTGFPSYWNVVVYYLYLLRSPSDINALVLLILTVMVFVPIKYVYPFLPPILRPINTILAAWWVVSIVLILVHFDSPDPRLVYLSLIYPVYHLALSFYLHLRTRAG